MKQLSEQEVFDKVAGHLLKQNNKCYLDLPDNTITLAYHGFSGRKSGFGCLIPDDIYEKEMEDLNMFEIMENKQLAEKLGLSNLDPHFVEELCRIHALYDVHMWRSFLHCTCFRYYLEWNFGEVPHYSVEELLDHGEEVERRRPI